MSKDAAYFVDVTSAAKRDLKQLRKKLSDELFQQIDTRIVDLGDNPRPHAAVKLENGKPPTEYRIRCGSYRVLYAIDDKKRVVTIGRVRDRKEAY